jgi:hypothetical protein
LLCGASGCGKTMVGRALAAHVRNELLAHAIVSPCASWTNEPVLQYCFVSNLFRCYCLAIDSPMIHECWSFLSFLLLFANECLFSWLNCEHVSRRFVAKQLLDDQPSSSLTTLTSSFLSLCANHRLLCFIWTASSKY